MQALAKLEDGLFGSDSRKNFLMESLGQGNGGMPIPGSVTLLHNYSWTIYFFSPFSAFLAGGIGCLSFNLLLDKLSVTPACAELRKT